MTGSAFKRWTLYFDLLLGENVGIGKGSREASGDHLRPPLGDFGRLWETLGTLWAPGGSLGELWESLASLWEP